MLPRPNKDLKLEHNNNTCYCCFQFYCRYLSTTIFSNVTYCHLISKS